MADVNGNKSLWEDWNLHAKLLSMETERGCF